MAVSPVPEGCRTLTPTACIRDCDKAIAFYRKVFGAEVVDRFDMPGGKIAHAEIKIGDSVFMMGEAAGVKGWNMHLAVYVRDCDAVFARAVEAGAKVVRPLTNEFYGDRKGEVADPFGNHWSIATHVEDVSPAEMQRRFKALAGDKGS